MSNCVSFHAQLTSILEVLTKTAVAEITKLVDDGSAALRFEMNKNQRENETLRRKLLLMERELMAVRGYGERTPDNSLNISFEVQVCDEFREAQKQNANRLTTEKVTRGRFDSCGSVSMKTEDVRFQPTLIKCEPEDEEQDWSESLLLGEDGLEENPKSRQSQAEQKISEDYSCGTSQAAAADSGVGPLFEEQELQIHPCLVGDPERGLQVDPKQDPGCWPLTPPPHLMKVQCVWSEAGSLGTVPEKPGQSCGKDNQREEQVNLGCHDKLLRGSSGKKMRLSSRERMARYRARINGDPIARAAKLAKRRERYQMRKAEGFLDHVPIGAMSAEAGERRRSQWRLAQKRRRDRSKRLSVATSRTAGSAEMSGESSDAWTHTFGAF